ncbi:hypothetical protein IT157_08175, partial [bacterium]|nr:hypothetical protein [bacterium]
MKWGYGEIDTFLGEVWELATHAFAIPIHAELRPVGQMGHDVWGRAGISMLEKELGEFGKLHIGEAVKTPAG